MTNTSSGQNYMFLAIFIIGTRSLANRGFYFVQFVINLPVLTIWPAFKNIFIQCTLGLLVDDYIAMNMTRHSCENDMFTYCNTTFINFNYFQNKRVLNCKKEINKKKQRTA